MIIDCISDLHGYYPKLEGGDLLIVAGDLTASDQPSQYIQFMTWLMHQKYKKKILIAGNHDNEIEKRFMHFDENSGCNYLFDSGTEFEGLKIWGSPWTKTFPGMNPRCKAFTVDTEEELGEKFSLIPDDIDILVTHSPPYGILDEIEEDTKLGRRDFHVGSQFLRNTILSVDRLPKLKLHVFGHIHEHGGKMLDMPITKFVNASHVNERYEPVYKPIRVIL